ncbi:MAG: hypothetical protein OXC40_07095, partial [Proteobacteria bacterium]|nr:hypothetical protein [Pseudomonadota bacterium]
LNFVDDPEYYLYKKAEDKYQDVHIKKPFQDSTFNQKFPCYGDLDLYAHIWDLAKHDSKDRIELSDPWKGGRRGDWIPHENPIPIRSSTRNDQKYYYLDLDESISLGEQTFRVQNDKLISGCYSDLLEDNSIRLMSRVSFLEFSTVCKNKRFRYVKQDAQAFKDMVSCRFKVWPKLKNRYLTELECAPVFAGQPKAKFKEQYLSCVSRIVNQIGEVNARSYCVIHPNPKLNEERKERFLRCVNDNSACYYDTSLSNQQFIESAKEKENFFLGIWSIPNVLYPYTP